MDGLPNAYAQQAFAHLIGVLPKFSKKNSCISEEVQLF
jgi:hypothetical protein